MPRGNVRVSITGDHSDLSRATRGAERDLDTFGKRSKATLASVGKAAAGGGLAVGSAGVALGVTKAGDEGAEAEKVGKQTEAVLRSTKGAARVTADEVSRLAEKLSLVAGVDDELIQRGANLLLTFKDIRNEAGRGNDIFTQTTKATLDMAAAMAAAN